MKEEDVMKLDISRRTGGATACSSNRWSSESRGKACFDYAESRQRKTTVNRWNSESRDISSHIIFADLQPVLSEVEV